MLRARAELAAATPGGVPEPRAARASSRSTPALFAGHPPLAVSQPDLLEGIVAAAARRPGLPLPARRDGARAARTRAAAAPASACTATPGPRTSRAALVVGADGRASIVRRRGGFTATQTAPPMDIVWCKLPALAGFDGARGYAGRGHLLLAYRTFGDQIQVGWAILKGSFGELRRRGVGQWVEEMAAHVTPDLARAPARARATRSAIRSCSTSSADRVDALERARPAAARRRRAHRSRRSAGRA